MKIAVREYLDARGESPFAYWFAGLEALAAAKVAMALYRLEPDNCFEVAETLNIHVILNGAQRSEESRRFKKRDSSLHSE